MPYVRTQMNRQAETAVCILVTGVLPYKKGKSIEDCLEGPALGIGEIYLLSVSSILAHICTFEFADPLLQILMVEKDGSLKEVWQKSPSKDPSTDSSEIDEFLSLIRENTETPLQKQEEMPLWDRKDFIALAARVKKQLETYKRNLSAKTKKNLKKLLEEGFFQDTSK